MTKSALLALHRKSEPTIPIVGGQRPSDLTRDLPRIPTGGYENLYDNAEEPSDQEAILDHPRTAQSDNRSK